MSEDPGAAFVPPAHYIRSDGARCCAHGIPVGPGSCPERHSLTDEHWDTGCTCAAAPKELKWPTN